MLERRDFLLAERGADRDREMASGIQHNAAALVARLQATGTSGVRAALGGSPVAYGSLRAAKCILTRRDCDVNSLTRRGTKSRSGQTLGHSPWTSAKMLSHGTYFPKNLISGPCTLPSTPSVCASFSNPSRER